ncbi:MAG TPA: GxxExxY protein [Candidatus Hydrogenedentes bacterium]|nr:GxxExxY protein [Candidatus Hydrogenedentota bacterium]HQM48243.1 GxxExxY protein [Candidatus Hydrogenedentota bacterium]
MNPPKQNETGSIIVDCAVALHRETGPGLLETVYEAALAQDLEARGLRVARQVPTPIELRRLRFDEGSRADLIVEDAVLVELKSVEKATKAHHKQAVTYPRLTGIRLGCLLDFGEALMSDGIPRIIDGDVESIPLSRRRHFSRVLSVSV